MSMKQLLIFYKKFIKEFTCHASNKRFLNIDPNLKDEP